MSSKVPAVDGIVLIMALEGSKAHLEGNAGGGAVWDAARWKPGGPQPLMYLEVAVALSGIVSSLGASGRVDGQNF
eukprot:1192526-Prorocentrum_minimum.AAC.1